MAKPILLLTRPKDNAARFLQSFAPKALAQVDVIISPLLEIVSAGAVVNDAALGAVIFTSANGVRFAPKGCGRAAFCVGDQTRVAAMAKGWQVTQVAQDADSLVAQIIDSDVRGPLTHLVGHYRRGDIAARLTAAGITTVEITLYDQRALPLTAEARLGLTSGRPLIVPIFSPRTAEILVTTVPPLHNVHVVAISPAVKEVFAVEPLKELLVAQAPTADEMRRAVEKLLSRTSLA